MGGEGGGFEEAIRPLEHVVMDRGKSKRTK